jgi:hypothetical protein
MAAPKPPPRSGARKGALSAQLRTALRAEAQRLEGLSDPVEVVTGVGNTFAALDAELERIAKIRLKAVHRLRHDAGPMTASRPSPACPKAASRSSAKTRGAAHNQQVYLTIDTPRRRTQADGLGGPRPEERVGAQCRS